jgi:hypothetical protein
MADFFSFDCEVLESRVQTTTVKNHYTLALWAYRNRKRYRNHKEKDFDESASKGKIWFNGSN